MAGEIAAAFVSIVPTASGMGANLSKVMNADASKAGEAAGKTAGSKFSGAFSGALKIGAAIGGAFVLDKAIGFFGDATSAASDLNETASKSKIIFGDQAAAIDSWASTAATKLGLSKEAALGTAAGFGNMFTQLGFTAGQSAAMSQQVVGLSADLGSFNNLPTADVADRISAAFRGEYDSLQTLIPNINAARVEQEALGATGKSSAKDLTAAEKAAAVLAIVNKDGAKAAGDFARTSDQQANSAKIATAQFEDQKAKLGQQLLPAMTAVTKFASSALIPAFGKAVDIFAAVGKFVGDNTTAFKVLGVGIGVLTVITLANNAAMTVAAAGGLAKWIAQTRIAAAATKVWAAVQAAFNLVMSLNPISLVVIAIAALVAGIVIAYKKSETFRDIVNGVWVSIQSVVMPVIDWFRTAIPAAFQWVKDKASELLAGVSAAWTSITTGAGAMKDGVVAFFGGLVDYVTYVPSKIIGAVTGVWSFIVTEAGEMVTGVKDNFVDVVVFMATIPLQITNAIGDLGALLFDAGKNVIQGLIDGITNMLGKLGDVMGDVAGTVRDFLPFSPAKRGPLRSHPPGTSGRRIAQMLAQGMLDERAVVARAAGVLAGSATFDARQPVRMPRGVTGVDLRRVEAGIDRGSAQGSSAPVTIDARTINNFPYRRESSEDTMRNLSKSSIYLPGAAGPLLVGVQ